MVPYTFHHLLCNELVYNSNRESVWQLASDFTDFQGGWKDETLRKNLCLMASGCQSWKSPFFTHLFLLSNIVLLFFFFSFIFLIIFSSFPFGCRECNSITK